MHVLIYLLFGEGRDVERNEPCNPVYKRDVLNCSKYRTTEMLLPFWNTPLRPCPPEAFEGSCRMQEASCIFTFVNDWQGKPEGLSLPALLSSWREEDWKGEGRGGSRGCFTSWT